MKKSSFVLLLCLTFGLASCAGAKPETKPDCNQGECNCMEKCHCTDACPCK